ncbi:MAG: GlxA family transcriptional regulator [Granulosicoccus sp.]
MQDALTVQFILQPHFSLLAFTAAADALTTANLVLGERRFAFETIGLTQTPVVSDLGIRITADYHLKNADPTSTDITVVCGGFRCSLTENKRTSRFLIEADRAKVTLGGIWNGCIALAHAQLMDHFSCALHPDSRHYANKHFPTMFVRPEALIVDRSRMSAAGPNSSFDLMLQLIQRMDSIDTVNAIRNILRADTSQAPEPETGYAGDIAIPVPEKLQRAIQLMRNNMDEPLKRCEIAAHLGMSTRAMERLFQRYYNTSPARYYLEMRLARAHEMLRQSQDPIGRIADSCGFISGAHFSRVFSKRFGCAPKSLRQSLSQLID